MGFSPDRLRLVLLGDPVAHSRSPAMHDAALRSLGLDGRYLARRVDRAGLAAAAHELREGYLTGANITMPHKTAAFDLADLVSGETVRAGSVNTWVREGRLIRGHSTDIDGVREVWDRRRLPTDTPALILGTGGAAAATLIALGTIEVHVASRSPGRAAALIERCGVEGLVHRWGEPLAGAVVVNCTPLGMAGEPLPPLVLESATGLLDMAYRGVDTPAVAEARRRDLPCADGIDLLVAQAERSFALWTGFEPPPGVMEGAARNG